MSSPSAAMRWFTMITTVYFPIKYYSRSKLTLFVYLLLIFLGCYAINLAVSESVCGSYQYSSAMIYTLFPWALIFGIMILMLQSFPGWLAPFSNTFGYFIAKMMGLDTVVRKIFKPPTNGDSKISQDLANIYTDSSILINEISPDSFENFWKEMSSHMRADVTPADKEALSNMVLFKYTVAEYIWYMLTGLLAASVSYNYVVNAQCGIPDSEIQSDSS